MRDRFGRHAKKISVICDGVFGFIMFLYKPGEFAEKFQITLLVSYVMGQMLPFPGARRADEELFKVSPHHFFQRAVIQLKFPDHFLKQALEKSDFVFQELYFGHVPDVVEK